MSVGDENKQRIKGARFPGRYIQGEGALRLLGKEIATFGQRSLLIIDRGIWDTLHQPVRDACANLADVFTERHSGDCTEKEILRLRERAEHYQADVIVGVGGGKVLDTAKAVAWYHRSPSIIVPTIAASDAPCSALAVVYQENGRVDYDLFLPRNPDLVVVDSRLIAMAPPRFLVAGMGDALATFCEAEACRLSNSNNSFGMRGLPVAWTIARQCLETLFEFGEQALAECREQRVGMAIERIIEANILLSGIGFESGGVAAAHAIHHGLCELDETHDYLHGEKVAVGVLAELKLQHVPDDFYLQVKTFCEKIGLPVTLQQLGIKDPHPGSLERIAMRACRPGEIIYNEAVEITPEKVVAVLKQLC
ncbi:glycerol dehydrogenase [[Erwinia] mediterraneensis]|uniref:glycerol dehydrogenase n=1 Tax=[Erwinia] mediterraneensis TaxID=2161819 RepID=UPI0010300260|nr:glycerol dehydrogenase [[Erwinia] mediterraneensis]